MALNTKTDYTQPDGIAGGYFSVVTEDAFFGLFFGTEGLKRCSSSKHAGGTYLLEESPPGG
jgi:hypothetical protein